MKNKKTTFQHWGLIPYKTAWERQEQLFQEVIAKKIANRNLQNPETQTPNYLIFCEHPHVYTLGKSGDEKNLLLSQITLTQKNIDYFPINRGGDITYHGQGQLVGYPIFDLEAIILTLAEFGIKAGRIDKLTGVWVGYENQEKPRKIAAIGVRASRWVTMHGFALNVNTDLSYFDNIIPCGISDKAVTSIAKEIGKTIEMKDVEKILLAKITQLFELEIQENLVAL